ncbi:MAG TPA: NUDIX domain-containing protein [Candidatus Paceibacterota bacterium]|nr:NUDIX domain-containing protein [Candidatus Paceibacterota bacterium]
MQKYTLAFIFNSILDKVLLMHKSRPASLAGKVNGLGGKLEGDEDLYECIMREVKEESDLDTKKDKWIYVGEKYAPNWHVATFCYVYEGDMSDAKSMEDQPVEWFDVRNLPENVMSNLTWIIPLCLDKIRNPDLGESRVTYKQ